LANPAFEFQVDGEKLSVELSAFGKLAISLNGKVVKSVREFGLRSTHKIDVKGTVYTIEVHVSNLFTGKITCSLFKNEELLFHQYTKAVLGEKNKYLSFILLIGFCGVLGYFIPKMGAWAWLSPILFIVCVVVAMSGRERIYNVQTKKT
jgi:hypothetical protein